MSYGDITNVTTGEVRLSYVHLFKPYAYQQGQEEKFQVTVLVPKTDTDTMARINAAIDAATECALRLYRLRFMTGTGHALRTGCRLVRSVKDIGYLRPVRKSITRRKWWTRWEIPSSISQKCTAAYTEG